MPQSFACLYHHLIFSTKNRVPLIDDALRTRLHDYLGGILRTEKCVLVAAGGMPDHVHLLVSFSKEAAVADVLRVVKTNSSKWIHETFPERQAFAWQTGYGAFSVSFSSVDRVKQYIAHQAEHHRLRTFQEEFVALLQRHRMPYDERFIWA